MGDKGSKDKSKREQQKKAKLSPKEKRKVKRLLFIINDMRTGGNGEEISTILIPHSRLTTM